MATIMMILGTVVSVAGSMAQAQAIPDQAEGQAQIAEYNAAQKEVEAQQNLEGAKLEETRVAPERQPVATAANEMSSAEWALPPTIRAWGVGVPLETVRFAAANHLCIELGYDGSRRVVEPYSLRRTRDGNLILHAIRADNRGHRAYRIDRIQSITVTSQPFTPVYKIEFSGSGPIHAPATKRSDSSPRRRNRPYTLECHYCGRKFPRSTRTTTLRRHNDANGYPCAGRRGYLIYSVPRSCLAPFGCEG